MSDPSFLNSRYHLIRPLSLNLSNSVYLVEDSQNNAQQLALKILGNQEFLRTPSSQIEGEFQILSRLNHPYIAAVYELGRTLPSDTPAEALFFTMQFINGSNLYEATRKRPLQEIYALILKIAYGLDFLHRHRLVHADIKPANIIIDSTTQNPFLVDFGLSHTIKEKGDGSGLLQGTLEYLPPETVYGGKLDQRSDIYSFALTLFRVFEDRLPFATESAHEILEAHRGGIQLKFGSGSPLPHDLKEYLSDSVQRMPWKRPAHLGGLIDILQRELRDKAFAAPLSPPLGNAQFIGRENLLDAIIDASGPYPRGFLVVGNSGSGKTALLEEIHHRLQLNEKHCVLVTAQQLRNASLLRTWAGRLGRPMDEEFGESELAPSASALALWHKESEHLTDLLLSAPGASVQNTTLIIDDLDQCNAHTRGALNYFLSHLTQALDKRGQVRTSIRIVASIQDKTAPDHESQVGTLPDRWQHLQIDNLSQKECKELLRLLLGQNVLPNGLQEHLYKLSAGNPFLLQMETAHLVQTGGLRWSSGVYQWHALQSEKAAAPAAIQEHFKKYLAHVPSQFLRMLQRAALFRNSFSQKELQQLVPDSQELEDFFRWALAGNFLRSNPEGLAFSNMGLKRHLYESCPAEERSETHRRLAHSIQERKEAGIETQIELAFHLTQANELEAAYQQYLSISAQLDSTSALAQNMECLVQAVKLCPHPAATAPLKVKLAKKLMASARYSEAKEQLDTLLLNKEILDSEAALDAFTLLIQIASRQGRYDEAVRLYDDNVAPRDEVFSKLLKPYAELIGQVGAAMGRCGKYSQAEKFLKRALSHARRQDDPFVTMVIECHQGELALQRAYLKPAKQIYQRTLRRLLRSKRKKNTLRGLRLAAVVHNNLGQIAAKEGRHGIALRHYENSRGIAQRIGNPAEECICLVNIGNLHYQEGNHRDARTAYRSALDLCLLLKKPREEAICLFNLGNLAFMRGELQPALDYQQRSLSVMQRLEDPTGKANAHAALAIVYLEIGAQLLANEHVAEGLKLSQQHDLSFQKTYLKLLEAMMFRSAGKISSAREAFRVAENQFQRMGLHHERAQTQLEWAELEILDQSLPHAAELIEKALLFAQKTTAKDLIAQAYLLHAYVRPQEGLKNLDEAQNIADSSGFKNLLWRIYAAKAELLAGGHGNSPKAGDISKYLRQARRVLDENSAGLPEEFLGAFRADPRHRLGRLRAHEPAMDGNIPHFAHSLQKLREKMPHEVTLRFQNETLTQGIDQLTDLFEINRLITAHTRLEPLLKFIMNTALSLTRAQRGLILLVRKRNEFDVACAQNLDQSALEAPEGAYSYSIAKAAITENRTIATLDALQDDRFRRELSVNHLKLRSVLSIPMCVGEKPIGAVYLDHPRRKGAFNEDDIRVLQIVANQAALAIETTRLRERSEESASPSQPAQPVQANTRVEDTPSLPPFLEAKRLFERNYLQRLMKEYDWNVSRAAAATGLYRQYLHRLLKKHDLN